MTEDIYVSDIDNKGYVRYFNGSPISGSITIPLDDLKSTYLDNVKVGETAISSSIDVDEKEALFEEFLKRLSYKPLLKHVCNNCGATIEMDSKKHVFVCKYCKTAYLVGTNQINSTID